MLDKGAGGYGGYTNPVTPTKPKFTPTSTGGAYKPVIRNNPLSIKNDNGSVKKDNPVTTNPFTPTSSSSKKKDSPTPSYVAPSYNWQNDINALFEEQAADKRDSLIDSIMSQLRATTGDLKNQINSVIGNYQQLINENELSKYRTGKMIRESQANRGQLGSGLGRQENLILNSNYDSKRADIETARENAVNEIKTLISQAQAQAAQARAAAEGEYNDSLLQWKLANQ